MQSRCVILSAQRTPVCGIQGKLKTLSAPQLGSFAIKSALSMANIKSDQVSDVLMGNVISAGVGQSPARQSAILAGIPFSTDATTINKVCASGLKAVTLAAALISGGHSNIMVAGGMESMSNVPFYFPRGHVYGHPSVKDGILHDGLTDAYDKIHMGECTEQTASTHNLTREMQDKHCIESYTRAKKAWDSKVFEHEIAPCTISSRKGDVIINQDDEYLNIDFSKVSTLKPVFVKTGTITAANASSLSDGAAALVLTSVKTASEQNLKPIAEILGFADAACAPKDFSIAPSLAIPKALSNAGISIKDVDLWELNEAFSAVALVNEKILGLDPAKVNIYGGAVALGHPIGSSGARILVTLVHALKQGQIGVAAICNGGGASTAIVVKKV